MFGCEITSLLHRGRRSVVYRGRRRLDGVAVVVKTAAGAPPSPERARALVAEREILRTLEGLEGVARVHAFEQDAGQSGLLLKDFGGLSLRDWTRDPIPLDRALTLALALVDIVDGIHRAHVIHKDLNPSNIVVRPEDGRVEIIDFASASLLRHDRTEAGVLGGMLAYVSPEQTGRMNRAVDYRTDFYSLGVTLFETLTGVLPFDHTDPLELVHAHVARRPPRPCDLDARIPIALSNLVLKLLAKDAEERYQSAESLRRDLARCQGALAAGNVQFDFPLAAGDRADRFVLPRRLYGREAEVERLQTAFEQASRGSLGIVTIAGAPGIGKSELSAEVRRAVAARRGYFTAGKFERHSSRGPYAAAGQAIDSLVQQMLTESPERLADWRSRISTALSGTAQVLIDLCPSFELVVGAQPAIPPVAGTEARVRLNQAVGGLLSVVATLEHPLCLFLDDMQWAGPDSLALVKEVVLAARNLPLLFILAFRDQDVSDAHPLRRAIEDARADGIRVDAFALKALTAHELASFVGDAVSINADAAAALAQIVHARTGGNPLFARAFLASLHTDGLLEPTSDQADIDLDRVRRRGVTDNVVDLLVQRIERLPKATQELLKWAACLGSRFDVETLVHVAELRTGEDLWPAALAELILPFDRLHSPADLAAPDTTVTFRFAHDRVQQAILSPLDETARQDLHHAVGCRLALRLGDDERERRLFEIVAHLNEALPRIEDTRERATLAGLNLEAARSALRRAAGTEALSLARAGIAALGALAWQAHYDCARDLHLLAAEAAFAWADHDALDAMTQQVLENAVSPIDAVVVRRLQGRVHQAQSRIADAIRTYVGALAQLGVIVPERPSDEEVDAEFRLAAEAVRAKSMADLLTLPLCRDPLVCMAMELLSKLIFSAYASTSDVLPLVICRLVRLSLSHGNTAESANGYTFYGLLLSRDHDVERACGFGQLALDLSHRFDDRSVLSQTYLFANYQLMHWKVPLAELAPAFRSAHQYGLEAGSPLNAACSATTLCICRFWSGENLARLSEDMDRYRQQIVRFRQTLVLNWHEVLYQMVLNLSSDPPAPTRLVGPVYDEQKRLPVHEAAGDHSALFNYHVAKMCLCYVLGDFDEALASADTNRAFVPLFTTALWAVPVTYVDALCRLAACDNADADRRAELVQQATRGVEKMTSWLPHNPRDIEHRLVTLRAELARVRGETAAAGELFKQAVALARASGSPLEEALTSELAAKFSARAADGGAAKAYLRAAHRAYAGWGAVTKVRALEREHPHLLLGTGSEVTNFSASDVAGRDFDLLDLVSVLNASRAISSEIRLDRLLQRLMALLIESGGAQAGYLLLQKEGRWVVEAGQSVDRGVLSMLESVPMAELGTRGCPPLATSIVNYVARTGETLVLDDASKSERFARDPHVAAHRVVSVLCFPLKRQGEVLAIAYLENNLARGAFTINSLKILEMLSSQAVISLENAILYEMLEQRVEARTRELRERNDDLAQALERLVETQRQLVTQEKLAALGSLTAGIAHEIKNPLNFVSNFAEVSARLTDEIVERLQPELGRFERTAREDLDELLRDLRLTVTKISEHGLRASGIVSGMALHARASSGRREVADLNGVLAQSVTLASHGLLQHREDGLDVRITTDYDPNVGPVAIDVQDITRVFVNLINNARHAVGQNAKRLGPGYAPVINVCTRARGNRVEVRVRDNGVGVPKELLDRIFVPFFTTKPSGEGTGLGLSISHDIVNRGHGGELRVESVEGEFAEFIVALPA